MTQPLQHTDLIFSPAASALKDALGELKRSNLSIKNRLRSIKEDSELVTKISDVYGLPLVANERCGSWYIPPGRKAGSAYFKSTDGHFGQWGFSLRRLNLGVLEVVGRGGGCVIVDSTRRGKSMPDALSKTVPIWIAVLNRVLFPDDGESHELRTPLDVVSESEHAQIEARLDDCVHAVRGLNLEIEELRRKLHERPLQVAWQRPGDSLPDLDDADTPNLVVLCTASNQTSNATSATSDYVQGAADDPESWSHCLDAATFWQHQDQLLSTAEDDLPALIQSLMIDARKSSSPRPPTLIKPTRNLWIGDNAAAETCHAQFDIVVSCTLKPSPQISKAMNTRYIDLTCTTGKVGSRQLRTQLPKLERHRTMTESGSKILVTCESGRDLAVGAAVAMLCLFFDEKGKLNVKGATASTSSGINKMMIKQRLSWIMVAMREASPSRATLQSVNAFLMG